MAYYPSFNSQLIRCAVDPNTFLTLKGASHTLYTKVNEAPITTHLYTTRFDADLRKHKTNQTPESDEILGLILNGRDIPAHTVVCLLRYFMI
jgi:hypothetical protein